MRFNLISVPVTSFPRQQQRLHGSDLAFREILAGLEFLQD